VGQPPKSGATKERSSKGQWLTEAHPLDTLFLQLHIHSTSTTTSPAESIDYPFESSARVTTTVQARLHPSGRPPPRPHRESLDESWSRLRLHWSLKSLQSTPRDRPRVRSSVRHCICIHNDCILTLLKPLVVPASPRPSLSLSTPSLESTLWHDSSGIKTSIHLLHTLDDWHTPG
jgi:hypothetical protein